MPYRLIDPATSPRMRKLLHIIGGAATGLLLVGVLFLLVQTYTLAEDNSQIMDSTKASADSAAAAAESAARSLARIEDCTRPNGQCFKEGQERTAQAVLGITDAGLKASAAIAVCQEQGVAKLKPLVRCAIGLLSPPKP